MKRALLFPLLIALAVPASNPAGAQTTEPLLSRAELRALNNEISGELAQDYIRDIARFHRLQPSHGYTLAAEWVAEKAKRLGFSDVQIEKYPADGQTSYYMSVSSPAWDVEFAELWIVEPKEEKLAARIVPRREETLKGPVGRGLRDRLKDSPESFNLPLLRKNGLVTYEILNFIDGKNSLLDIRNAVSAEFEPLPLQWVEDYIRLLARAGVVIVEK